MDGGSCVRISGFRQPLGDKTTRDSNARLSTASYESYHQADGNSVVKSKALAEAQQAVNRRISAVTQASHQRTSRYTTSYATISPDGTIKKQEKHQIGPWALGKTLGQGSSAHVRKGQHRITGQTVAVKIVAKTMAHITQAGSLANLDRVDTRLSAARPPDGTYRMPVAIEREVAILKLVQHPNILQLFDIWENRHEIYLVTEFVEKGDLFDFINWNGPIREEEALWYFRQIMAAIDYCHSLNICHRDLKPENILLKADGTIKIADFGMAALHQNRNHQLRTACGSPHYAAPELLRHQHYKGSTVDIWSMGVILYAMLAGCLPFDDEDVNVMLRKALRADFVFPPFMTPDAKDLISKILVGQPAQRITMKQMWKHALIKQYSYLDNHHLGSPLPGNITRNENIEPVPEDQIDPQILRQLTTLWHCYSEGHLIAKLQQHGANDQKLFYWLLYQHRQNHLENFNNQLLLSKSDFHHFRPPRHAFTKRVATCHFADEEGEGEGPAKGGTKFTVVSDVPDGDDANAEADDANTIRSYDPYNANRVLQATAPQAGHAKVTVHRSHGECGAASVAPSASRSYHAYKTVDGSFQKLPSHSTISNLKPHDSAASSVRTTQSNAPRVVPSSRTKRNVDFSSFRHGKQRGHRRTNEASGYLQAAVINQKAVNSRNVVRPLTVRKIQPRQVIKPQKELPARKEVPRPRENPRTPHAGSEIWNEELRKYSVLVAEDCDKAFQSSTVFAESALDGNSREGSPFSLTFDAVTGTPTSGSPRLELPDLNPEPSSRPWANRPLPPTPPATDTPTQGRNFSAYITPLPLNLPKSTDRRAVSEPLRAQGQPKSHKTRHLTSINESAKYAPKTPTAVENQGLLAIGAAEQTIRVVHSPTAGPIPVTAPLNVRKISQKNPHAPPPLALTAVRQAREKAIEERETKERELERENRDEEARDKVASWFKRAEKQDKVVAALELEGHRRVSVHDKTVSKKGKEQVREKIASKKGKEKDILKEGSANDSEENDSLKKKGFRFSFALWKKEKEASEDLRMSVIDTKTAGVTPTLNRPSSTTATDKRNTKTSNTSKQQKTKSGNMDNMRVNIWRDDDQGSQDSGGYRKIEVHQNWLFRLFRVKPAQRHMCFIIPRQRSRQEIAIQLRQWRRFGIRDIEADKERNIIWARLGEENYLNLKEVSFAIQISAIIEHGKGGRPNKHYAIARFTQERGAASSFSKVVDALQREFTERNLLITDKGKIAMMVQTLKAVHEEH